MRFAITQLSSREQVGVALVVSAAAIACYHLLWLGPARAGMAAREQALAAARVEIARAEAREREAPDVQRVHRALAARADVLHAAAASTPDAPGILRDVQAMAGESELWVTGLKPVPPVGREHVIESSVALEFEGTYANVLRYLEAVAEYPRLVTVTDLRLHAHPRPGQEVTLAGSCRLVTFVPREVPASPVDAVRTTTARGARPSVARRETEPQLDSPEGEQ
jgi:Tfp pilus assembly protein PilO